MSDNKQVVLGVTGSIAAYKAADIVSRLKKLHIDVRVILTEGGAQFITPLTLETLSGAPVYMNQFSRETAYDIEHISLAKRAEVFVVAPATANFIGKAANGIADDLLSTTFLATRAPVLIAPAMNSAMLTHPAVAANVQTLRERGVEFIEPDEGLLACGDVGKGRLAPVEDIVRCIEGMLFPKQDLSGKKILITAGPTREDIDPVRFLSNRSSGKMGFALASAAVARGAKVKLIAGPVGLETPVGAERINIQSSAELFNAVQQEYPACDALIMAAAPADFTVTEVAAQKIKKQPGEGLTLALSPTRDILAAVGENKQGKLLVGFAAETQDLEQNALSKLRRKNLDFIAANDVGAQGCGFMVDTNAVVLYDAWGGKEASGQRSKREIANWLFDRIAPLLEKK